MRKLRTLNIPAADGGEDDEDDMKCLLPHFSEQIHQIPQRREERRWKYFPLALSCFSLIFSRQKHLTSDECANVAALRSSSCAHGSEFNLIFQNLPPGMNYERVTQMKNMKTLPRRWSRSKVKLTRLPTRAGKMKEEKKKENLKSSFVSDEKCVCCFFLVYRRQALLTLARRAATYIEINLCKSHDDWEQSRQVPRNAFAKVTVDNCKVLPSVRPSSTRHINFQISLPPNERRLVVYVINL